MALISKPYTFTVGAVIIASEHNANFDTLFSDYNGNITNENLASGAAIVDSKLAQITTAGKVHGSALTSLSSVPSGAGVIPAANLTSVAPSGIIVLWSGTIATIPSGWVLCNGSNGTPDLRNLFVVGADADSGGAAKSTITGSALQTSATGVMPAHTHTQRVNNSVGGSGNIPTYVVNQGLMDSDSQTGSTGTSTKVIAVFYALAYIMKT